MLGGVDWELRESRMLGRVGREMGGVDWELGVGLGGSWVLGWVDWELGVGRGRLGAGREQDVGQGR